MRNFTFKGFNLFKLSFLISLFFITTQTRAQFPYSQSFKNSTAPGVLFGGEPQAFLTGGAGSKDGYNDANGSGYLRLTNKQGSQKGIVYSDMYSFPSAYGMTISFEYYTHGGNGADGIAFILFDATASPVAAGAFGGSLGYAQRNTETGFSKGYLGIGIDEYGNFSANNEGKSGGAPGGVLPSNVTLRGAGTGTSGYPHLISVQTTALASSFSVAGGDRGATDNSKTGFRKMEVVLKPRSGGGFFIDVYLTHGSIRELIINNYEYKITAPSNLKFAISSSTGGSNNFHEIRNLNITVDKSTLLTPAANADTFTGCIGLATTSGDITSNDNGSVNTLGTINKSTVDLDPAVAGIQTTKTVDNKGTFTYNSTTGAVTFNPLNNTVTGPVQITYTFNDTYDKTSNTATITYNTYTAITNNSITAPSTSTFCTAPHDPGIITGSTAAGGSTSSGGPSTLTYQWESSINNIDFNPISGATNESYDPPSTSTTAYYRRVVSSATCKDVSNVVSIVFGQASTPTATAATAITCNSFTANWNVVPNATSYGLSVSRDSNFSTHEGNLDGRNLNSSSTSFNVSGLTSGQTYYFKVWSFNSCGVGPTASNVITVTVGNGSIAGTISSAQTICSGTAPQDLTLSGYTGTIQWQSSTNNSSFNDISGAAGAVLTSAQIGSLTANTYYRAVVKSGACTAANTASVLITISAVPSLASVSQFATTCEGAPARINLKGLLPNTTSTIAYSIDGIAQTPVTGVVADGSGDSFFETVVLTAANNGKTLRVSTVTTTSATPSCSNIVNKDVVLNVNAASVGGTIASVAAICSGTSPANLILSGNNGSVLRWQKSTDSNFSTRTDINVASATLTSTNIGNLTVNTYFRAIVQNGACAAAFSDPVLVTVNALPAVLSLTGNTICVSPGGNGTISSSTSANGTSYQLYNSGNTAVQSAKSGNGSALTWTNLPAANGYYVIGTNNATTCSSKSSSVNILTTPNPDALVLTGSTICVSPGGNGTITSSTSVTGIDYQLYNSSNATVQVAKSGTGSALTWTNLPAGNSYYVIGTNTTTTCSSTSNTVNVATTLNPTAPVLIGSVICALPGGDGTISSTTSVNNVNYQLFDSNDVAVQSVKSGNGSALTWTNLNAANGYYVIATNAANCTVKSNVVNITTNPNPTISIGGTLAACLTTTLTTNTNVSSPTYVWYKNNTVISDETSSLLVVNTDGDYKVKVTNTSTGCETTSAAATVKVSDTEKPAKPILADITAECSATVTPPTTTDNCKGTITGTTSDSLDYSTQGEFTINWSFNDGNGNTETATQKVIIKDTQKPTITCPSTVVVSADANSCSATAVTLGTPVTSDNCTGTITVTNDAPSNFPIGNTTVTWKAVDVAGNAETCTQTVTVNDTQKPTITCPSTVIVSADANSCSATSVTLGTPLTSDNCTGTMAVTNDAPSTFPIGNTTVTWKAVDAAGNTETCTQIVKVVGPIIANDDAASINGYDGGTAVSDVLANDLLNCAAIVRNEVILTLDSTLPSVLTFDTTTGEVTVKPNTPIGVYSFDYKICEIANAANCNKATVEVTVTAPSILAVKEDLGPINGSTGGTTTSLIASDKLNGVQAVIGLNPGEVTLSGTAPAGLTVNADGTVSVSQGVKAGSYDINYTICDNNNAGNCSSATSTVTVTAGILIANLDTAAGPVTAGNTPQTLINIFENDTYNGSKLNPSDVKMTSGTDPKGYLTIDTNGNAVLGANASAGNYEITYEICELLNPANCSSNKVEVTVTAPSILAVKEDLGPINGSTGGTTTSLIASDKLNGVQAVIGSNPGEVTLSGTAPAGLIVNADGTVSVSQGVKAGSYDINYTICDNNNAGNCSSATSTVTVTAGILIANLDTVSGSVIGGNTAQTLINIFENDTNNGSKLNPSDVKMTSGTDPKGYLTIDTNGNAVLGANAPAGNYEITYEICELLNPGNCSSNKVEVTVTGANLVANEDLVPSAVGVNASQTLINVFANDTKNGNALVPSDVKLTAGTDPKGYLTLDENGNVILAPNAPAGDYELPYTICEKLNTSNCSSNVVKVTVTEPKMTVTADSYCSNNVPYVNYTVTPDNFTTTNLLTIKWIDSANNVVATQTNLPLSGTVIWPGAVVDGSGNGVDWPGWVLNNGQWTEGSDGFELTKNGVKMEFSLNPTVTVSVAYPAATSGCNARPTFSIKANDDEAGPVDVKKGVNAIVNIFTNDLLNGVKPNPSDVILSTVVANSNLTLNANGSIDIAANTPNGVHELTYQICDASNTGNCSQAVIKITVLNSVDPAPPTTGQFNLGNDNNINVDGINGSIEFVNVLDNDLINGQPINSADVVVKPITTNDYFEWNADGTVSVKPNTPGGNYPLTYQVCEKGSALNCATAVLNVFVEVPAIAVVKTAVFNDENKSGFANAGETITYNFTVTNTGNVPLINVLVTDPLTGVVVSGQAISLGVGETNNSNFSAVYKITQEDINRGSVSNQATVKGSSARGVNVEDLSDDSNNSGDNPTVLDLNGCSIKVLNAFSPNGDEKNARFYIRGIECYPENTVEIYNRWGVLVFSIDHYNNTDRSFTGYSNGRSTVKQTDGLPVGTYFYILKYKDSASNPHQESSYLYINK